MKKVIALFLLASLLVLAGCSESSGSGGVIPADETITGNKFSDYDAYLSFVENYNGPFSTKLVTADRLFILGSWKSFSFEWGGPPERSVNGQWYAYWLEAPGTSDPVTIQVEVYLQPEQAFVKNKTVDPLPIGILTNADCALATSMVQLETREESFKIVRNDVTYAYYKSGKLSGILIEVEGILYFIHEKGYTSNDSSKLMNLDESSALARLLSLDEDVAKEAFDEIKASLTK